MFTRNPINGADERVIEASWGLGEAVVAGLVIPDNFRIDRAGQVLERQAGAQADRDPRRCRTAAPSRRRSRRELRRAALPRRRPARGAQPRSPRSCEEVYGPERDIEWAFAGGSSTCSSAGRSRGSRRSRARPQAAAPADAVAQRRRSSPTSTPDELAKVAALFKERRFAAGETVIKEGSGGAAFFVIESGEATVTIGGEPRGTLARGRPLRRDRADRRGRAHGDDHRRRPTSSATGSRSGSSARSSRRTARSAGSSCRRSRASCAPPSSREGARSAAERPRDRGDVLGGRSAAAADDARAAGGVAAHVAASVSASAS